MARTRTTRRPADVRTVWLDPGRGAAPRELVEALTRAVRLVVVPRTGGRQVDAAVLLDPCPDDVRTVRAILPGTELLVLLRATWSSEARVEARRAGARLLPAELPTEQLIALLHPGSATRPAPVREDRRPLAAATWIRWSLVRRR